MRLVLGEWSLLFIIGVILKILCVSDFIDPLVYNSGAKNNFPDIDLILCAGDLPMDYIDFIVTTFNKPTYFVFGNHDLKEYRFYHKSATATIDSLAMNRPNSSDVMQQSHGAVYAGFKTIVSRTLFCNTKSSKVTVTTSPGVGVSVQLGAQGRDEKSPLIITGVSGSMRYNNGLCQYTDAQMFIKLLLLVPRLLYNKVRYGKYLDIFLTHAAPCDIHDKKDPCHLGFGCFNWFLQRFKPRVMIHGHIHLYDNRDERCGKYFDTFIINAYAHCVLEI